MNGKITEILSAAECQEIARNTLKLRKDENVNVISYAIEKASSQLFGFLGEYYKLNIRVADEQCSEGFEEFCYFVKSVPISNELHRADCERKFLFRKEGCAYTEILPNIQKYASTKLYPECYYVRKDLLVLEDLTIPSLAHRHLDKDEPYTDKHRKLFLAHLAQLHAGSIAWEEREGIDIGVQFKDDLFELMLTTENEWYLTGAKGVVFLAKNYREFQTSEIQTLIDTKLSPLLMDVQKYTKRSTCIRNVFLHRDSWERNIFFKFDSIDEPSACCIVDFQLSSYAPPALDILFFLYGQTTAKERQHYLQEYLDYYFAELQARFRELELPIGTITKTDFLEDCRRAHLPILILMAIIKPLTMMPEGTSNKWRTEEQEKFDYYMNTQRDEMFLRLMANDPTYESKIMWPIEELIEQLQNNQDLLDSI